MNKVWYKIFGAMCKDSYGEMCKYFGIVKVEESIGHRQKKIVQLLILYYSLLILCVSCKVVSSLMFSL